jgi:hypothetical protein
VKFWREEWRGKFFSIPLSKRGESIAPYKKKPKKLNLGGKLGGSENIKFEQLPHPE